MTIFNLECGAGLGGSPGSLLGHPGQVGPGPCSPAGWDCSPASLTGQVVGSALQLPRASVQASCSGGAGGCAWQPVSFQAIIIRVSSSLL